MSTNGFHAKAQKAVDITEIIERSIIESKRDLDAEWREYMSVEKDRAKGRTRAKRLDRRLINGRAVKPCGKECHEWGYAIIRTNDHKSMKNSKELVNDKEFLYQAMRVTPSPKECTHFFYDYVNKHLKINAEFRLELLRNLFKNKHILMQEDIEWFVNTYHFEHEYKILKKDQAFIDELNSNYQPSCEMPAYLSEWNDIEEKKEKRRYAKNVTKIHNEAQSRHNSRMNCFKTKEKSTNEASEPDSLDDDIHNTDIIVDFKF